MSGFASGSWRGLSDVDGNDSVVHSTNSSVENVTIGLTGNETEFQSESNRQFEFLLLDASVLFSLAILCWIAKKAFDRIFVPAPAHESNGDECVKILCWHVEIEKVRRSLDILFWSLLWFALSMNMVLYNKWLMHSWQGGFDFPLLISTAHMTLKYFLSLFIVRRSKSMSSHLPEISRSMWWDLAVPIGVATALDVAASNASYLYLSVSLYTIVKSSNLIFTLLFSILYYLREPSSLLFASVFIIVVGMVLFSSGSIMFSWIGFFLVLGASAISGFRWSLTEVLMRQLGCRLHAMLTIYLISPASAVVLVPLTLLMELPRYLDSQFSQNPFLLFLCLVNVVVGGLFAFAMILVELELLRRTSCLTISVISYAKMFSQIILSVLIFHDIISLSSWIGIFLTIVGMFCYSMSSRENDSRPMYVVQKSEDNEECESSVSTLSDQLPPADEEI